MMHWYIQWISNFAPPCRVRDLHFYKEATNIFVTATKKGFLSTTGKRKTRKITSFSRLLRLLLLHLPSLRFPRKIHSSYSATTGLRLSVVVRGKGGSKKSRMLTGRPAGYKWNVISWHFAPTKKAIRTTIFCQKWRTLNWINFCLMTFQKLWVMSQFLLPCLWWLHT